MVTREWPVLGSFGPEPRLRALRILTASRPAAAAALVAAGTAWFAALSRCALAAVPALMVLVGLFALAAESPPAQAQGSGAVALSAQDLQRLLGRAPTAEGKALDAAADARLAEQLGRVRRDDDIWPIVAFLRAELLLQGGRSQAATEAYRALIEQAASNPYQDTWGGHGLAAFALYRWLQLQPTVGARDRAAFERIAGMADTLLQTRLVRSAFTPFAILSSMPRLEEQIYRALAVEALRLELPQRAGAYFIAYLGRVRSGAFVPESDPLYQVTLAQGLSTPDRLALLRGKRLVALGDGAAALPQLEAAARSEHDQTRLEATYLRARASDKLPRTERAAMYREVQRYARSDELAQSALLHEGLLYGAREPEFARLLGRVVREYPDSAAAADALYWLSAGARIGGDLDGAQKWLGALRQHRRAGPLAPRTAVHVALALLWRDAARDAEVAQGVLQNLVDEHPASDERVRALFWLGRIAERAGREPDARQRFGEAVRLDAYGYYGLRARMHLIDGAQARSQTRLTQPQLLAELRAAHALRPPPAPAPAAAQGVYARRLGWALDAGLYRQALAAEDTLRRLDASRRLQELTFEQLDATGLLAPIAVMLALRQDGLAAVDADPTPAARLALARRLGDAAGDHPALLNLLHPLSMRPVARRAEVLRASGYLGTAYPVVHEATVREAAARWNAPPALLYAVMRQESLFYTAALSPARALGLFQFIPSTFDDLDKRWKLLAASGAADRTAFLMNEKLSIELGARWFGQLKLPASNGDAFAAMLGHHSGDARVRQWQAIWNGRGWGDDVETMIESFRMHDLLLDRNESWGIESREFARRALLDYMLADALQLYAAPPPR